MLVDECLASELGDIRSGPVALVVEEEGPSVVRGVALSSVENKSLPCLVANSTWDHYNESDSSYRLRRREAFALIGDAQN